jgi:hypothetical protein
VTILPYQDHGYIRFISDRTGETLFEIKMLEGSLIVWGSHYRPNEFDARRDDDGGTVAVVGTLHDRIGPVVTFGECLNILSGFRVELGSLPADFDPSWAETARKRPPR